MGRNTLRDRKGPSEPHTEPEQIALISGLGAKVEVGTQGSRLAPPWALNGCRRRNSLGLWGNSLEADMVTRGKATQTGQVRHTHTHTEHLLHTQHCIHMHTCHPVYTVPGSACPKNSSSREQMTWRDSVCLCTCITCSPGGRGMLKPTAAGLGDHSFLHIASPVPLTCLSPKSI